MNRALVFALLRQRFTSPFRMVVLFFMLFPPLMMCAFTASMSAVSASGGMFAMLFAAGAIGQDVSSGVLQLLFARPVSRRTYVTSRWFAAGAMGATLGIFQLLLAALLVGARGGSVDPSGVLALILENTGVAFATAAVMVMLSSLVNGLGDLGLLFLGVVSTQMLNGLAMLKGWKVLERIAKELLHFLQPELHLGWIFGRGEPSWFELVSVASTLTLALLVAIVMVQRKELSYAAD